jgi:hypothetical protein
MWVIELESGIKLLDCSNTEDSSSNTSKVTQTLTNNDMKKEKITQFPHCSIKKSIKFTEVSGE